MILGSNAWNGSTDGLFCWNSNNAVGNSDVNNGALATSRDVNQLQIVSTCATPDCGQNRTTNAVSKFMLKGASSRRRFSANEYVRSDFVKRLNNLIMEETITEKFCKDAIKEAAKHKHKRRSVRKILAHIDEKAKELKDMILNETFKPSPYVYKTKIEYGKVRKLCIPRFFLDQCIHHILIMLIRDFIIKRIDPYAIASIPKRGQIMVIKYIKRWKFTKYVIKGDIQKCFESIEPQVIMDMYKRMIKDKKYLRLKLLVVYNADSLPLGNYCSAFDLNLLLKNMDEYIRSHKFVKHYIRYMDDFVIFVTNRRKAKKLREGIAEVLAKIGLKLKENYQLYKFSDRGLDFVGYRFFGKYTILRKRNLVKIYRQKDKLKGVITEHTAMSILSRLGFATHCFSSYARKLFNMKHLKDIVRGSEYNWLMHSHNLQMIGLH